MFKPFERFRYQLNFFHICIIFTIYTYFYNRDCSAAPLVDSKRDSDTALGGNNKTSKPNDDDAFKCSLKVSQAYTKYHEEKELDATPNLLKESTNKNKGNFTLHKII